MQGLHISNDILQAARAPIKDVINHEIHQNRRRIHQQAEAALRKVFKPVRLKSDLVRCLDYL